MTRYIAVFLLACALIACSQATPNLTWVAPTAGSALSGVVNLQVSALQEPHPENVVFYAEGQPIAKAYPEDGMYQTQWDTTGVQKGIVALRAKPFSGPAVEATVTIAARLP